MQEKNYANWCFIINKAENEDLTKSTFDKVLSLFNDKIKEAYYICHDKDDAYKHYHLLIKFDVRLRKSGIMNFLTKNNIDLVGIQISNVSDFAAYARYLVHKDDIDKYQYSSDEVVCINSDLSKYLSYVSDNNKVEMYLSAADDCWNARLDCIDKRKFVQRVGLGGIQFYKYFDSMKREEMFSYIGLKVDEKTGEVFKSCDR